jgi:energy-coupling factor transporter ATP-binding protein EcfA2
MERVKSPYQFVSLPPFEWRDIPRFAVLTGTNGVGKSHLLWLLAAAIGAARAPDSMLTGLVEFDGRPAMEGRPPNGGYLPALWILEDVKVTNDLFGAIDQFVEDTRLRARAARAADRSPAEQIVTFFKMLDLAASGRDFLVDGDELAALGDKVTHTDVFARIHPYAMVRRADNSPLTTMAQLFYAHINARVTLLLQGKSAGEIEASLPSDPCERANELLREFEVGFRIEPPIDLRFPYTLRCRLPNHELVKPNELSSGEQAILALVALVITAEIRPFQSGDAPMLLLLDEPDAHLHTYLLKNYLAHLEKLTSRNFQVIMVTHRPETMLLAPDRSLVEMNRIDGVASFTQVPPVDRSALVARLAADSVAVIKSARIVLVEDDDDRAFHQRAYDLCLALPRVSLPENPRLAFMPVMAKPDESEGSPARKGAGGGGWTAVVSRLREFAQQGFRGVVHGLIDGDNKTDRPSGVVRLERYSIESYWTDPLGLYEFAVRRDDSVGRDMAANGRIGLSDLADLRSFDQERLQRAADVVIEKLDAIMPTDLPRGRCDTVLHHRSGSVTLRYPLWLWHASKAQLEDAVTKVFSQQVRPSWRKTVFVTGLVPADLAEAYRQLVTERP